METKATQISDRALIIKCQAGDKRAFEMLSKRYYQKAYSMALYWIHNREAALDISQEAFVRIYRNIRKFETEKSFPAWMYMIIKNLCRSYAQRRQKRWMVFSDAFKQEKNQPENSFEALLQEASGDETLERDERRNWLWETLNRLPAADREIIILKDLEDFSYKEISETLEIPIGSVMSRLYYARKKLAKRLRVEIK